MGSLFEQCFSGRQSGIEGRTPASVKTVPNLKQVAKVRGFFVVWNLSERFFTLLCDMLVVVAALDASVQVGSTGWAGVSTPDGRRVYLQGCSALSTPRHDHGIPQLQAGGPC
jgi:hypothetical protein